MYLVDTHVHTNLIKQAVEAAFEGVKVANVNTINGKPKQNVLDVTGLLTSKKLSSHLQLIQKAIELFAAEAEDLRRK